MRTFESDEFRAEEVEVLTAIYSVLRDYHQGLGFVVAFLLLFLPKADVATIAIYMERVSDYHGILETAHRIKCDCSRRRWVLADLLYGLFQDS